MRHLNYSHLLYFWTVSREGSIAKAADVLHLTPQTISGQLKLLDEDFVKMTRTVKSWANEVCKGRVVSCLEGGYNLETLGETVRNHVAELNRD